MKTRSLYRNSRREFLKYACTAGALIAATQVSSSLFPLVSFAGPDSGTRNHTEQQTKLLMGTMVTVTAVTASSAQAEDSFARAFAEMERLVTFFDRHDSSSVLSLLNAQGFLSSAPAELAQVVYEAQRLSHATNYAFNPAITPVIDLFETARTKHLSGKSGKLPQFGDSDLKEALALAKPAAIKVEGNSIRMGREGMRITLDGIAKGYIADQASRILSECGIKNHLVNAGGDIRCSGQSASGEPWSIGVQHPAKAGSLLTTIRCSQGAVATSGSYENYYDRARTHHHLFNSMTGKSADIASVTVQANSAIQADALATALAIMPPSDGIRYLEKRTSASCLIVDSNGRQYIGGNWG